MKGKEKCKILKEIRREIAANNDIEFVTSECKHQGDCLGTCPKCEAELRYLERELEKRQRLGKAVAVAGLTVSVALTSSSCDLWQTTEGDMLPESGLEERVEAVGEMVELMGDMPLDTELLNGQIAPLWEIEYIASLSSEEALNHLKSFTRDEIKAQWSAYKTSYIEAVAPHSCDCYKTDDFTMIVLLYDEAETLISVDIKPEHYDE